MHHFSDPSEKAHDQSSYLRLLDTSGKIHCTLLVGKPLVIPIKYVSILILKLTVATHSVKVSKMLQKQLDVNM